MTTADPNLVILTGENPFIRLARRRRPRDDQRQFLAHHLLSGRAGACALSKSELTQNGWRIWTDNIAMARWLQTTVQGMLNAELLDARSRSPRPSSASRAIRAISGPSGWWRATRRSR